MRRFAVATGNIFTIGIAACLLCIVKAQNEPRDFVQLPDNAPKPPYKRLTGPTTLNPGNYPEHWPYADEYDALAAAPEVHHLRYMDSHIQFIEVAYFPGVQGQMHGHPFPSVFAVDSPRPKAYNLELDPQNKVMNSLGPAPEGMKYPTCMTMGPQAPHTETNLDTFPHHFYRLAFIRLDGRRIQERWREWYPHMLDPLVPVHKDSPAADAPKFSEAWPYPIAYDSYLAAPNNNKLLYEDDHIRLIEVTIRPGETEPMQGVPYPSVIADDTVPGAVMEIQQPGSESLPSKKGAGHAVPPPEFEAPTCSTFGPQAPQSIRNTGVTPIHFYRIEFKRIDGEDLKTHWKEWYPWMATLEEQYKAHPYSSNFH
jgi:hypothetical protein